jgi:hypothetical protein
MGVKGKGIVIRILGAVWEQNLAPRVLLEIKESSS